MGRRRGGGVSVRRSRSGKGPGKVRMEAGVLGPEIGWLRIEFDHV